MKITVIIALLTLISPLTLHAEGKINYSGIPCKWTCTHDATDEVGPKKADPAETREDRRIMRQAVHTGWVERGDGRLLLVDRGRR